MTTSLIQNQEQTVSILFTDGQQDPVTGLTDVDVNIFVYGPDGQSTEMEFGAAEFNEVSSTNHPGLYRVTFRAEELSELGEFVATFLPEVDQFEPFSRTFDVVRATTSELAGEDFDETTDSITQVRNNVDDVKSSVQFADDKTTSHILQGTEYTFPIRLYEDATREPVRRTIDPDAVGATTVDATQTVSRDVDVSFASVDTDLGLFSVTLDATQTDTLGELLVLLEALQTWSQTEVTEVSSSDITGIWSDGEAADTDFTFIVTRGGEIYEDDPNDGYNWNQIFSDSNQEFEAVDATASSSMFAVGRGPEEFNKERYLAQFWDGNSTQDLAIDVLTTDTEDVVGAYLKDVHVYAMPDRIWAAGHAKQDFIPNGWPEVFLIDMSGDPDITGFELESIHPNTDGLGRGELYSVYQSDAETVWVGSSSATLFRGDYDAGQGEWNFSVAVFGGNDFQGFIGANDKMMSVHFFDENHGAAATYNDSNNNCFVIYTSDGGATWEVREEEDTFNIFNPPTLQMVGPETIIIGFSTRFQISEDAGLTWDVVFPSELDETILDLTVNSYSTENGMFESAYLSQEAGNFSTYISETFADREIQLQVVDDTPALLEGVSNTQTEIKENTTQTVQEATTTLQNVLEQFRQTQINNATQIDLNTGHSTVFKMVENGAGISGIEAGSVDVAFIKQDNSIVSRNGTELNWQELSLGADAGNGYYVFDIPSDVTDVEGGLVTIASVLLDQDPFWVADDLSEQLGDQDVIVLNDVEFSRPFGDSDGIGWTVGRRTSNDPVDFRLIMRSDDDGESWQEIEQYTVLGDAYVNAVDTLAIDPAGTGEYTNYGAFCTDNVEQFSEPVLYIYEDGQGFNDTYADFGQIDLTGLGDLRDVAWSYLVDGGSPVRVDAWCVGNEGTVFLLQYFGHGGSDPIVEIYGGADATLNWEAVESFRLDLSGGEILGFAVAQSGVAKMFTYDLGTESISDTEKTTEVGAPAGLHDVAFEDGLDPQVGFVVGSDAFVAMTSDQGNTWSQVSVPVSGAEIDFYSVDMVGPNELVITGTGGIVLASDDQGTSWEVYDQSLDVDLRGLHADTLVDAYSVSGEVNDSNLYSFDANPDSSEDRQIYRYQVVNDVDVDLDPVLNEITAIQGDAGWDPNQHSLDQIREAIDTVDVDLGPVLDGLTEIKGNAFNSEENSLVDLTDRLKAAQQSLDDTQTIVERIVGLSKENFRITNQEYNDNNQLIEAVIEIYDNAQELEIEENPLAVYRVETFYDIQGRVEDYRVSKIDS